MAEELQADGAEALEHKQDCERDQKAGDEAAEAGAALAEGGGGLLGGHGKLEI